MDQEPAPAQPPPLRSVHTSSFPPLMRQLGISLLVTTYQAGKLVIVRADGDRLNTHFRAFPSPMGLALAGDRLALGTRCQVWEFHNVPAAARKLPPDGRHDACFLPRSCHVTGNVQIHEMAWAGDELWFVNTRFSCLCTLDRDHSFVSRWRPPFVSALTPEDRCHLNGLGMVEGRPALRHGAGGDRHPGGLAGGQGTRRGADRRPRAARRSPAGCRCRIRPAGTPASSGCSSRGPGRSASWTPTRAATSRSPTLPGFTRGLDFHGRFAFIGLSQVRETAVFSGIPITERLTERTCGVWVVDIRTGQTVAFLRFEDALQEIFAVQVLPGRRYPDLINDDPTLLDDSFVLTDEALEEVPAALRSLARDTTRAANE